MKTNTLTRRQMLGGLGATALINRLGSINAFAQGTGAASDYKALVCILLAGGNDGHNTVIPQEAAPFAAYKQSRGGLALPDNNGPILPIQTAGLGTKYALSNGLQFIHPLWTMPSTVGTGSLAVLANVGMLMEPVSKWQYQNPTASQVQLPTNLFSHADQIQQMQSGIASSGGGTGWGGRAADALMAMNGTSTFPAAVSLSGPSLYCTGGKIRSTSLFPGFDCDMDGMNLFPQSAANARFTGVQKVLEFDSGMKLVQAANQSRKDAMDLNALLTGNTAQVSTPFPGTPIGAQLKQVAKIIKIRGATGMGRQVFFCVHGGFDTHASQSWWHWNLLYDLSEAMRAFYDATVNDLQIPEQVTAFTISDFGRTLQSSGSGCDHGWGSHHMIMGGAVKGGEMYGTFPDMHLGGPDDTGTRGALIPTTSMAQYGATLARWFGVPDGPTGLDTVFPSLTNFTIKDLGFMG